MNDVKQELEAAGVSQEQLKELKERHGRVWLGRIGCRGRGGEDVDVVFLYREPRHGEADLLLGSSRKPVQATRNLLASCIVAPERDEVLSRLRDYPLAMAKFVDDELLPFFGHGAETESREL